MTNHLLDDMHKHFNTKLRTLISDVAETCDSVDIEPRDIVLMIISGMSAELVRAAVYIELTEDDYLQMCRMSYRTLVPDMRKQRAAR